MSDDRELLERIALATERIAASVEKQEALVLQTTILTMAQGTMRDRNEVASEIRRNQIIGRGASL